MVNAGFRRHDEAALLTLQKKTPAVRGGAKSAQETFVAEATKIGELYKTFAQDPGSLQAVYFKLLAEVSA